MTDFGKGIPVYFDKSILFFKGLMSIAIAAISLMLVVNALVKLQEPVLTSAIFAPVAAAFIVYAVLLLSKALRRVPVFLISKNGVRFLSGSDREIDWDKLPKIEIFSRSYLPSKIVFHLENEPKQSHLQSFLKAIRGHIGLDISRISVGLQDIDTDAEELENYLREFSDVYINKFKRNMFGRKELGCIDTKFGVVRVYAIGSCIRQGSDDSSFEEKEKSTDHSLRFTRHTLKYRGSIEGCIIYIDFDDLEFNEGTSILDGHIDGYRFAKNGEYLSLATRHGVYLDFEWPLSKDVSKFILPYSYLNRIEISDGAMIEGNEYSFDILCIEGFREASLKAIDRLLP